MNTDKKWEIVELDTVATGYKIKSLMKVSFQAVYRWQKGETLPTISNMYILGQLLGTDVDDMLVAKEK